MTREDKDKQILKAIKLLLDVLPVDKRDAIVAHIIKGAKNGRKS